MEFSTNQKFEISGSLDCGSPLLIDKQLFHALQFALHYADYLEAFASGDVQCMYQIVDDNTICIGWSNPENKHNLAGWKPFETVIDDIGDSPITITDFDIFNLTQFVYNHLIKQNLEMEASNNGSYEKGFIIQSIRETLSEKEDGIIKPFYGIIKISSYTCFYHK